MNGPTKKSAAGIVRSPSGPCATRSASSVSRIVLRSEAGSPWAIEPPIVPLWRTCGSPTYSAACGMTRTRAEHRVAQELGVARERADRDAVAVLAHVAQVVEPSDVDEHRGARKAEAEQGDQRLPAGEHLRVLAAQQLDRLVERSRPLVLEPRGNHASPLPQPRLL